LADMVTRAAELDWTAKAESIAVAVLCESTYADERSKGG
jgi:hypothetical protein